MTWRDIAREFGAMPGIGKGMAEEILKLREQKQLLFEQNGKLLAEKEAGCLNCEAYLEGSAGWEEEAKDARNRAEAFRAGCATLREELAHSESKREKLRATILALRRKPNAGKWTEEDMYVLWVTLTEDSE